jgi:hypothetical protein
MRVKPDSYPYKLGGFQRKVTTSHSAAQKWFNRGFLWCYAFHHEESARCFERSIEEDPACAMAYWGVGPLVDLLQQEANRDSSLLLWGQTIISRGTYSLKKN